MLAAKQRPLARPARPAPRAVVKAVPDPVSSPRVPIARAPVSAPSTDLELPAPKALATGYSADHSDVDLALLLDESRIEGTLSSMKAAPTNKVTTTSVRLEDLLAIAQLGQQYLAAGSARLARVIFEGLVAHAPGESYFHVALGIAADRVGDKRGAAAAFKAAIAADPKCPRAELDLAELYLEADQLPAARGHLRRALDKAYAAGDRPIADKASAVLALLDAR